MVGGVCEKVHSGIGRKEVCYRYGVLGGSGGLNQLRPGFASSAVATLLASPM